MLNENQCGIIEAALTEEVEPRKVAAYLCLHMGLTLAEASAIRLEDIDFEAGALTVRNALARIADAPGRGRQYRLLPVGMARTLPMPPHVARLLYDNIGLYRDDKCFLISGEHETPKAHLLQNLLVSLNDKYRLADKVSAGMLREAFVRRCLESGIDLYTVSVFLGVKQLAEMQKKYGDYLQAYIDKIDLLERYTAGYTPPVLPAEGGKFMNLLILGAGSQGPVVKEIAEALGLFKEIAFLDDDPGNGLAIDSCANYARYIERYPIAIPSFGQCELRGHWADKLRQSGFILPTLIHPSATVSPTSVIEPPAVIEMKAVIGTRVHIGRNCIISASTLLNPGAVIGEHCHIGGGVTIMKGAWVPPFSRIPAGAIFGA
ncbi:MAG: tyrosine-type recombinase/integrase [Syntrophomonadaceae bacterium]|nr:tyrosine-type recombinase/integrase [Syntrophomonadaceae bacterium]